MTWKAKIAYTDGRLDLIEPDSLVSADVLPALTSPLAPTWRFRFDNLDRGLWVDAYAFSTDKTLGIEGRPAKAAPLEPSVCLQILDADDLKKVHSVVVDDDVWLLRVDGALVELAPVLRAADELGVPRDKASVMSIVQGVCSLVYARRDEKSVRELLETAKAPSSLVEACVAEAKRADEAAWSE